MENNNKICDVHIYDAHGIDIGELNTVAEVVKYVNETGYAKISGFFLGQGNQKVTFEVTVSSPK